MSTQTSKFGIVPFGEGHIYLMDLRERERQVLEIFGSPEISNTAKAVTVVEYGEDGFFRVLGVIGMRIMWQGVADVFLIPCKNLKERNIIAFVRQVKNALKIARDEYGIRRFQTASLDDEMHNRWHRFLGFEDEGTMKEYSINGEDYKQWALRQL